MVCFRYVIVNSLYKVDNKDNNNNNNNNNTINYRFSAVFLCLSVVNPQAVDQETNMKYNRKSIRPFDYVITLI